MKKSIFPKQKKSKKNRQMVKGKWIVKKKVNQLFKFLEDVFRMFQKTLERQLVSSARCTFMLPALHRNRVRWGKDLE